MIGAIPNPTKKVAIDFPFSQVKNVVSRLQTFTKYRLSNENPVFNQYTYSCAEFLSMGVLIDININELTPNKTEISIEVRRKMGAFDSWVEIQNANIHIQNLVEAISKILINPATALVELKKQKTNGMSSVLTFVVCFIIIYAFLTILGG